MEIPYKELATETLRAIIEDFVSREGTDYGPVEYSFEEKCKMVRLQLASGKALIEFDSDSETALIVSAEAASEKKSVHRFKDGDPL